MGTDQQGTEADEFVAARWNALCRFGYLMTGDAAAAQDLVQEAIEKCLPRWERLERRGAESYIRKVMSRLAWKDARRAVPTVTPDITQQRPLAEDSARTADVARALARLPRDQRVVIVLRYWLDYDESTIAEILGCRRGTVKSRASRAYTQLRSDLNLVDYDYTPSKGPGHAGVEVHHDRP